MPFKVILLPLQDINPGLDLIRRRAESKKQVIGGKTVYPIDIFYNGIGILNAPSADEYEKMFQERLKQKYSDREKTI